MERGVVRAGYTEAKSDVILITHGMTTGAQP